MSNYKSWKDDVITLEKLIRKHDSLTELKEEAKKFFPDRSWSSIRSKIYRLEIVEKIKNDHIVLRQNKTKAKGSRKISRLSETEKKIFKMTKKEPVTLSDVSTELGLSKNGIVKIIDSMREKGYDVNMRCIKKENKATYLLELERGPKPSLTVKYQGDLDQDQIKFLVIGDTGFGLKAYQPELISMAFKKAEEEDVDFAVVSGITGGYATRNKRQDFYVSDLKKQVDFAAKMPKVSFKTYFLNDQKDLKHKTKGALNPALLLAGMRENYYYAGDIQTNFHIHGLTVKVIHGKEGSTYAKSYMVQGMKENIKGNVYHLNSEEENPDLLIVAGVDTFMYLPAKKSEGMEVIGLPLLHAQTDSQSTKKTRSGSQSTGYTIVTVDLDEEGNAIPGSFEYEWFPLTHLETPINWRDDIDLMSKILDPNEKKIIKLLESRPRRYGEISRKLNVSKDKAKKIVRGLRNKGFGVFYDHSRGTISIPFSWTDRSFEPFKEEDEDKKKTLKVAAFSDTHIGNRDARVDLIEQVYKIARQEEVDIVTHSGDVFDGTNAYKAHEHELVQHGADEQRLKAEEIWPDSEIETYIIAGSSHEWVYYQQAGHNVVKMFAENMPNMNYIGGEKGLQGTKKFNGVKTRLYHPTGGLSYARSYKPQKFINNFIGEEDIRESVRLFLIGHLHVPFAMLYRGVAAFLVPCLEEQTWYLKGKSLFPSLGMWITTITLDRYNNVIYLRPKYIPFASKKNNDD